MKRGRPPVIPAPPPIPESHGGALHGTQPTVPPAGSHQGMGSLSPRQVRGQRVTDTCETLAHVLTPQKSAPKPRTQSKNRYAGSHFTAVLEAGGPTHAGGQPPALGQTTGGMGQGTAALEPTQQAQILPVTALGGNIKATLNRAAPECAAVLFEHINRLTNLARYAESNRLYAEAMEASNLAGRLAIKTIEMTVGKQLNIKAEITGQSSIPAWDKLPQAAKDYYKEMSRELAKLPDADTATIVEGTVVPHTDEATYTEGGYNDTAEIPRSN